MALFYYFKHDAASDLRQRSTWRLKKHLKDFSEPVSLRKKITVKSLRLDRFERTTLDLLCRLHEKPTSRLWNRTVHYGRAHAHRDIHQQACNLAQHRTLTAMQVAAVLSRCNPLL